MPSTRSTRREARAFDWGSGATRERSSTFLRADLQVEETARRRRRKRQRGRVAMIVTTLAVGGTMALLVQIAHVLRIV